MTTAPPAHGPDVAAPPAPPAPPIRRRRGRRVAAVVTAAVILAAAVGVAVAIEYPRHKAPASGVVDNSYAISTTTIRQETLTSQVQDPATLGYTGSYSIVNREQGVYTALPVAGDDITQGHSLYSVADSPVYLLYGRVPAYRALSEGMTGTDVRQLNADLVRLGYATKDQLDPTSDYFGAETAYALERLQDHFGLTETGNLPLGQAVFLPTAVRVTAVSGSVGGSAGPMPVITATSTTRQVTVEVDATAQASVKVGQPVTITLPDNSTTPGVVSSVGTVAAAGSSGGSPTITVEITPTDPKATGSLDKAPVQATIVVGTVPNALVVPVDALLALAGGGFAVEEIGANGVHSYVPVTPGLFDDAAGTVQITGSGLAAGQRVVVPAS
jgi:hypothetical protein